MRKWYAVHTHPHGETKAALHLKRQGFDVYLPRFLKKRSHARVTDWVPAPLFPRYLFVGMDLGKERWRAVQSTVGVSHLVSFGSRPAPVPNEIIDLLHEYEDGKGLVNLNTETSFAPGDKIEILTGPFSGEVGIFENLDDQGRITVLLDIMGRQTKIRTSSYKVAAVN